MKSVPSGNKSRRMTLAEAEAMTRRDRRRMIVMSIGAVLLLVAYFGAKFRGGDPQPKVNPYPTAEITQEPVEVYTRPFESEAVLETIVDGTEEQRLVLAGQAIDELLKYSITLQERNYDAIGVRVLDQAVASELLADPAANRVAPLRLRGRLARLTAMNTDDVAVGERQLATLELDDGTWAHLAFLKPPGEQVSGGLGLGDHVRMDGLFTQVYRAEVDGEFREGPLVVGTALMPSTAPIVAAEHEALCEELRSNVQDDTLTDQRGQPFDELWALMAFARDRADEIDWEAAPELDNDVLQLISNDGTFFRGRPFRIPISRNQGSWVERAPENGLRLDKLTTGWVGNTVWKSPSPVINFVAPANMPELSNEAANRLLTARGFFLKNVYYEKMGSAPGKAPLFVFTDIQLFVPQVDPTPRLLLMGVVGGTLAMIVLIFFLVRSDSRSSKQLQEEMVRRRRERRARAEAKTSPQSP
jgi:hypothetical protein